MEPSSLIAHSCTSASPKIVLNVAEKEIALMGTPITASVSPAFKLKLRVSLTGTHACREVTNSDVPSRQVGENVGSYVGLVVGPEVGEVVGPKVGRVEVGLSVGSFVGRVVGRVDGLLVGLKEGALVGLVVGQVLGDVVG